MIETIIMAEIVSLTIKHTKQGTSIQEILHGIRLAEASVLLEIDDQAQIEEIDRSIALLSEIKEELTD